LGKIKYFYFLKSLTLKFLQTTIIALLAFCFTATAQQKVAGKAIIKTPGMHCDLDKDKIEKSLFKQYGITSYKANLKLKNITVTWLTDRTDIEQIKTMIANVGYDADDVTAEESVQKKLPEGCKVIEEVVAPKP
jgi:periplasmic mercuric ion binding protein